ncbi:RagB/SusD family nutrient uptake outer membrane protein [Haliscomenobacter hydrossis]|uniref:RagB/SusD domain-containing protein n=1 Tax=Haliscomenobacter hydrossis (strain ATCC 27775 / DSM 1100 / LMG 10767 / O) TaxID=760192 RepID=F4L1L5_HALH1|nr:RagB/SusD family nutrient uptake outer membrane protein [Haliscomenobacter hydrossis]AEE48559.1 RagB/SusD domain-containing protein [Haliscomenobacter hydrossis DSM 1100]
MRNIIIGLIAVLFINSCNDDFVNTQPLDQLAETAVWTDGSLAEAFVSEIYAGFGNGGFDEQMLASLTDETIFTHPGRNITTITESRSNPADPGWINGTLSWVNMYSRIRAANLALSQLETPKFTNPTLVDRLKGEAKFMRAYYYQQLLRYFGGVPIVDKPFTLDDTDFLSLRNTYEECVNFIVKDCDEAAVLLDGKTLVAGRATKASALALKSRVLLYAASDLHDIPTAKVKSSVISAYAKPELVGYVSGDRAARWTKARDAAKAVLDLPGFGFQLGLAAPAAQADAVNNYMNASLARNGGEKEIILGRYFINAKQENGGRQGLFNGPNGYHNWAGNTPIQLMIDDYEMMDGSKFDWSNPTHAAAPYTDRDPRFYASILHDGSNWKPRTSDVAAKDPANQIQTGTYEIMNGATKVPYFGLDTRKSSVEDWNGSYTGYYVRKFIDPNPAIVDQNTWQQVPWPVLRYTEAIFNYAEACIELGQDQEARTWLNKVRFRAGMPALTESGDALKQRFRNEKRIEMYLEEQRYHDTRRWMIAPTTLGRKANGININGTLKAGKTVTLYKYDPSNYDYTYKVFEIDPGKENRAWLDKQYYLPIHRDEINRNNKLVQNPGY